MKKTPIEVIEFARQHAPAPTTYCWSGTPESGIHIGVGKGISIYVNLHNDYVGLLFTKLRFSMNDLKDLNTDLQKAIEFAKTLEKFLQSPQGLIS